MTITINQPSYKIENFSFAQYKERQLLCIVACTKLLIPVVTPRPDLIKWTIKKIHWTKGDKALSIPISDSLIISTKCYKKHKDLPRRVKSLTDFKEFITWNLDWITKYENDLTGYQSEEEKEYERQQRKATYQKEYRRKNPTYPSMSYVNHFCGEPDDD